MRVQVSSYWEAKEKFPNAVVLIKRGDFYEVFEESARIIHYIMGYKLIDGYIGGKTLKKTGIPLANLSAALHQLEKEKVSFVVIENYETKYIKRFKDEYYVQVLRVANGEKKLNLKITHINGKKLISANTKVTIEYLEDNESETYHIFENNEKVDIMRNEILEDSLIAKSLIGHVEGDEVIVEFPTGISKTLKVINVI